MEVAAALGNSQRLLSLKVTPEGGELRSVKPYADNQRTLDCWTEYFKEQGIWPRVAVVILMSTTVNLWKFSRDPQRNWKSSRTLKRDKSDCPDELPVFLKSFGEI